MHMFYYTPSAGLTFRSVPDRAADPEADESHTNQQNTGEGQLSGSTAITRVGGLGPGVG